MMRTAILLIFPCLLQAADHHAGKSFLQVGKNIDDDNAQAAEMARLEDQADKIMGEDDGESSENNEDQNKSDDEDDSFIQLRKHMKTRNIDDDNAEAAEMARLENQSDKIMGEDDDESSENNDSDDENPDAE